MKNDHAMTLRFPTEMHAAFSALAAASNRTIAGEMRHALDRYLEAMLTYAVPLPPAVFRTGRKVGRTIYQQVGSEPSDDDVLVGTMDTPQLAQAVVGALNARSVESTSSQIVVPATAPCAEATRWEP